jgi:hypothetical protein
MSILLAGSERGDHKRGVSSLQSRRGGEPVMAVTPGEVDIV